MRAVSHDTLEAVLHDAPEAPRSIEGTGIDGVELMKLMIKDMYVGSRELPSDMAEDLGLSGHVIRELLQMAQTRKLVEALGDRIARAILRKFGADAVTVTVRKPKPIAGVLEHTGVRIRRTREEL